MIGRPFQRHFERKDSHLARRKPSERISTNAEGVPIWRAKAEREGKE